MQTRQRQPYFRPYTITDVIGAEIAGTGKNIVALACGIADGLGLGLNTAASLITRGLNEVCRLGVALGGKAATFAGLAGLGDLVATCSSPLSRNRSFGGRLARVWAGRGAGRRAGRSPRVWSAAARSATWRSGRRSDMPITEAVYRGLLPASAALADDQHPDAAAHAGIAAPGPGLWSAP